MLAKFTPRKKGSINSMFNELFHNLEFTTEAYWKDFVSQYKAASVSHQLELQKRNESITS